MNKLTKQAYANVGKTAPGTPGPDLRALLEEGLAHHREGRYGPAATIYGRILEKEPEHFDALHLLAVAAHQTGNSSGALSLVDRALSLKPASADALSNKSSFLMELGRYHDALAACEQSLAIEPASPDAMYNAGNALAKIGRREQAIARYRQALVVRHDFVACLTNLGGELIEEGQFEESRAVLERAVELDCLHAKAWLNLGVLAVEEGDRDRAMALSHKALEIEPTYARARENLSNLFFEQGQVTEAFEQANIAFELAPDSPGTHNAIGNCYRALGMPQEAAASFRRAIVADAAATGFHSNLLLTLLSDPNSTREEILDESLRWAARHAGLFSTSASIGHIRRIGFVSPDFRSHPVGYFIEPLLANLQDAEVFLYANQTACDEQTLRLKEHCAGWREIVYSSTDDVVNLIKQDRIDLLVDLAGHTSDGRLDVFAKKPAPLQATWLGYSGTTGLAQFDALIADPVTVPRSHEDGYSETILRLKNGFAPFIPSSSAPVTALPALSNGHVTFGSFNSTTKINEATLQVWSAVLKRVEGSRLFMKNLFMADELVRDRIIRSFAANGIEPERLTFCGQVGRDEHFDFISQVDIALDTTPYSGATTTADCLWMGVPVVTIAGDRYSSRMSASFLESLGLGALICDSAEAFVESTASLASDLVGLGTIRASLRGLIQGSPRYDGQQFAAEFLAAVQSLAPETTILQAA